MTTQTETGTTQVYRVWIKAAPEKIWAAITDPEWNARYGYAAPGFYELRPGGSYRSTPNQGMIQYAEQNGFPMPDTIVDGEVLEVDPPRRLVQTWRMLMDPTTATEPFTRVTYLVEESQTQPGVCKLTVIHELAGAPATAALVSGSDEAGAGGGWAWILSDLKSLVETGETFND
ncbi:SRPBCC domain-containing protein [Jidongwangia harbinensis]|uniref:SRPBCC domain-containing protein n=1 Tax=Jidongwangia harbinensis TaxID=2878561 RepID=UPI001CD94885|nr:SRPBCC domain-containing protein [Jidongwangia harbinensis]MCA2216730.1 SRPBCC domain-containing protein [Jidongwangia harbinensis]